MKKNTMLWVLSLALTIFLPQISRAELVDANNVLGQLDFTTKTTATTQNGMNQPRNVTLDAVHGRLFVTERMNNRVLVYDVSGGITDQMNAVHVLGQTDFVTASSGLDQNNFSSPFGTVYDSANDFLYVADSMNHRVLVFDVATINDGENAIYVLGQADFVSNAWAATQNGMNRPEGLALDSAGNRLFVSDYSNKRILVFDVATITDGENAVNVLGQPDFVTNTGSTTQSGMSYNQDLALDADRNYLFVTDACRVLVFDVSSITDGENAINVLGESDFTSETCAFSQTNISYPWGLGYDSENQHLFVGVEDDYRVQVWDVAEIIDGEPALAVLGHANFDDGYEADTLTRNTFDGPMGMAFDFTNNRMFLADSYNSRVLVFSPIPYAPVVAEAAVADDDSGIDKSSKSYKLYQKYKDYRGNANKAVYKEMKKLKKENYAQFQELKGIFSQYRYLSKAELKQLPQETQDDFAKYKTYRGYKKYKLYKEKVFGD